MFDNRPSEAEFLKKIEMMDTGYFGVVGIEGVWDEPGHPNHGKVMAHCKFNTITYDARKVMARALAGETNGPLTQVGWGTGTTPPVRGDTDLQNQVQVSPIIQPVSYPTIDSVVFSSVLPRDTGTGFTYSEVGLKSAGGLLFARFVFPGVYKFAQLRMTVNWQIIFI